MAVVGLAGSRNILLSLLLLLLLPKRTMVMTGASGDCITMRLIHGCSRLAHQQCRGAMRGDVS